MAGESLLMGGGWGELAWMINWFAPQSYVTGLRLINHRASDVGRWSGIKASIASADFVKFDDN